MKTTKPVLVIQLPETLNLFQARDFMAEVLPVLAADRPRVVFDFAEVRRIDSAGVDMLVECLETVMQHDGDVKLAAITPEVLVILELTRVDRLFQIFDNTSDAAESFRGFPVVGVPQGADSWYGGFLPTSGHGVERLTG
jgi:anti-sigma B factor antagonist